jgi:hypothetical protein
MRWWVSWIWLIGCVGVVGPAQATSLNELKIAVRVFDFLSEPPHGKMPLAVIYDGQSKASQEDAMALERWINSGVTSLRAQLVPTVIDAAHLDQGSPLHLAIIADGSGARYAALSDYARRNHMVTVSADPTCLAQGACSVGVATSPRIEVVVNRSVAEACGIEFSEAFRMMVREY